MEDIKYFQVFLEACHRQGLISEEVMGRALAVFSMRQTLRVCALCADVCTGWEKEGTRPSSTEAVAKFLLELYEVCAGTQSETDRQYTLAVANLWLMVHTGQFRFQRSALERVMRSDPTLRRQLDARQRRLAIKAPYGALLEVVIAFLQEEVV